MAQQNATPLIATFLGIIIGGVSGFYVREFVFPSKQVVQSSPPPGMGSGGGPPAGMTGGGGPPGGMMGGGGGFGGGNNNSGGTALARLVRNLDQIQQSQGKGLTPDQGKTLLPILEKVKAADKLPAEEADKYIASIEGSLNEGQKKALEGMQAGGFGGGGGGRGGGMGGPPGGGRPGGGMPGGGGPPGGMMGGGGPPGGGGGRPDPEKPFASERNQKSLDSLIAGLGKP